MAPAYEPPMMSHLRGRPPSCVALMFVAKAARSASPCSTESVRMNRALSVWSPGRDSPYQRCSRQKITAPNAEACVATKPPGVPPAGPSPPMYKNAGELAPAKLVQST